MFIEVKPKSNLKKMYSPKLNSRLGGLRSLERLIKASQIFFPLWRFVNKYFPRNADVFTVYKRFFLCITDLILR